MGVTTFAVLFHLINSISTLTGCRLAESVHAERRTALAKETIGGSPDTYSEWWIHSTCALANNPKLPVVLVQHPQGAR